MTPHGETCKCGAAKKGTAFFCPACTARLPRTLLYDLARSQSWPGCRALIRRAVTILGIEQTRNAQHKQFYAPA